MPTDLQTDLHRTPLYNVHVELGARMVGFAGYEMPVQFPQGIIKEHLFTRKHAGLFDVSHMGQILLSGPGVAESLETIVPLDLTAMAVNRQAYTVLLNPQGGIIDDLIVTRWSDEQFFLVVNAACKQQDTTHLETHLDDQIKLSSLDDRALLALQGPAAAQILTDLAPAIQNLVFMSGCETEIMGIPCYVTRSGYTGEDGFELSVPNSAAETIARKVLESPLVEPVGLGARDSLRLEAGLCLYGHDMDTNTCPVEAGLTFAVSRSRRAGGAKEGGFPGAGVVLSQIAEGVARKRVGLNIEGRAPVREGAVIEDLEGNAVGVVTSGGFGASVNAPIAMGYVDADCSSENTRLHAIVRGKPKPVTVAQLPFVPQRYVRG